VDSLKRIFGEPVIALAIASSLLFLSGWVYLDQYYSYFGIDHKSLALPYHYYFVSPWISLTILFVAFLPQLTNSSFNIFRPDTSCNDVKPTITKRIIKHTIILCGLICVTFVYAYPILQGDDQLGIFYAISLLLFLVLLYIYSSSSRFEDDFRNKSSNILRLVILGALVIGLSYDHFKRLGHLTARMHSLATNTELPYVMFTWKDPAKYEFIDAISRNDSPFKLLYTKDDSYIVFVPRIKDNTIEPIAYNIPKEEVLYYIASKNISAIVVRNSLDTIMKIQKDMQKYKDLIPNSGVTPAQQSKGDKK
jgi:hypothetical protein